MVKRKAEVDADPPHAPVRRSSRNKPSEYHVKSEEPSLDQILAPRPKPSATKARKSSKKDDVKVEVKDKPIAIKLEDKAGGAAACHETQYWLMKAEPETRIERGHDISFSIDDLADKSKPEPWDGIRNYAARNNLRAMKKGDLAFFYHSSCKAPAIVGIMEIVEEHSPDLTAQDPEKPYYDPKDNDPDNSKWSVVHVEFRRKFNEPVTLSELKEMVKANSNHDLKNMDLLGRGRLSVGKVSKKEWNFIMNLVEKNDQEELRTKCDLYR